MRHAVVVVGIGAALVLAGCGSSGEVGDGAAAPSTEVADEQEAQASPGDDGGAAAGGEDCTSGMSCADGLIAELAVFPVPETVDEFGTGSPDMGGRSLQTLFLDATPDEAAAFYEAALADAGFEVTPRDVMGTDEHQWDLVAPDGRPGSIWIRTASSHPTQVKLGLEVGG